MNEDEVNNSIRAYVLSDEYPDIDNPAEQIAYYKMEQAAKRYAQQFFSILSGVGAMGKHIPLVFRDRLKTIYYQCVEGGGDYHGAQFSYSSGFIVPDKQAVIFIDLPRRTKNTYLHKSLKRSIRHELIHYYLWLRDVPFEDDTALFWCYCYIYSAEAYLNLSDDDQEKYNDFVRKLQDSDGLSFGRKQELADEICGVVKQS